VEDGDSRLWIQVQLGTDQAGLQDVGGQRSVLYSGPGSGRHRFGARAADNDGVWSLTPVALDFTVGASFWQTAWFAAAVGLVLVVVGAAVAWRASRARRRRAQETLAREREQSAALLKLSLSPALRSGDLGQAFDAIARTTAPILGVGRVSISVMDDAGAELRGAVALDFPSNGHAGPITLSAGLHPGYFGALRAARAVDAADASRDERTRELVDSYLVPHGIGALLDAPARVGGRVVGSIRFEHRGLPRIWREDEVGFAAAAAEHLARALLHAERERAHQALLESEERFRLVVEAAPSAMLMVGEDGKVVLANAWAERVFGYPRHELVGMDVERLVPPRFRARHRALRRDFFADPVGPATSTPRQLTGVRKSGEEFAADIGLGTVRTRDGVFVLCAVSDVSPRLNAEIEVQQQRTQLAHLARITMLGELSGSLAHELNQPLTAVLSNAQAAQRFLDKPEVDLDEVREILKDIVAEDKRAGEVIHRLRLLLKKGEINPQPLDINEVVLDVLKLVRSDVINHDVTVETDLAPDLPAVHGDRVQIQQVLLNLVMNACDAVSRNDRGNRLILIRTSLAGESSVCTTVSDRGTGIAPDQLDRIFDPFFTTKANGMGLGLSVCRTIVAAHTGSLSAENNPGGGASFHLSLQTAGVAT
jgi:two-component system sensor kinase FixL